MKRYILSDMGNVMSFFKFRALLVQEIMAGFGVTNLDLAKVFQTETAAVSDEMYYHGLDTGQIHVIDVYKRLMEHCGIGEEVCSYPMFLSLWCRHLEPIKGVVGLYRNLQENFPLVIVSNGDAAGVRHITHHLVGTYGLKFQEVFISGERGRKKPDLLEDVVKFVESQGVNRADCVFVDDLPVYVQAAENLGIPSIQFDGSKQSSEELKVALANQGFIV